MGQDTTVRLNKQLVTILKHLALSHNTTLKQLLETMIKQYAKKELKTVKERDPLLFAVITAEEVEPYEEELDDIKEEKKRAKKEKTFSLDEVRKELDLK